MINRNSTRYYSDLQEKAVAKNLGGKQNVNSGASKWVKGDVVVPNASLLIECKTFMTDKESVSIKKEWITKNRKESKEQHLLNSAVAFGFGPNPPYYYIIDEALMTFLVEKLIEENA